MKTEADRQRERAEAAEEALRELCEAAEPFFSHWRSNTQIHNREVLRMSEAMRAARNWLGEE